MKKTNILYISLCIILLAGCNTQDNNLDTQIQTEVFSESIADSQTIETPQATENSQEQPAFEVFDAIAAAEDLSGEWLASLAGGYYVFESNGTVYCYMDESKSNENVFVGTWEVTDGLFDVDSKVIGFTIIIHYTSGTIGGVVSELDNTRVCEMYPKGDKMYHMENITMNTSNILTRMN